jgi:hypothetical protein
VCDIATNGNARMGTRPVCVAIFFSPRWRTSHAGNWPDSTCGEQTMKVEMLSDGEEHIAGLGINEAVAEWIRDALDIRIGERAALDEEAEAVETVLEIVHAYAVGAAHTITIQRRQATVERELGRTPADFAEDRRKAQMRRILAGKVIGCDVCCRGDKKGSKYDQ